MINPVPTLENDNKIRRLIYRSWHRGCKETDEALGAFARDCISSLPAHELAAYERLLEEDDWDIWNWLTGKAEPGPAYNALIHKMKAHIHARA